MATLTLVFVDFWVSTDSCSQGLSVALWLCGLTDPDFEIRGLWGGFVVFFFSPKRQRGGWYWTCVYNQENRSQLTTFFTFSCCNIPLEIPSCTLKESQASGLISALIQHRDNFFPLLLTDYCPNRENSRRKGSMTSQAWRTSVGSHSEADIDVMRNEDKEQSKSEFW